MASRRLSDPPSDRSPERRLSCEAVPDFPLASLEETSAPCDVEEYSEDDVEPLDTCFFNPGVRACGLDWERPLGSGDCGWGFVSRLDGSDGVGVGCESPSTETTTHDKYLRELERPRPILGA